MPNAALPAVLRGASGAWYGKDGLWTSLPDYPADVSAESYNLKHPWVTLARAGDFTSDLGPPTVRAQRLHGPGRAAVSSGGYATAPASPEFWPTVIKFPTPGCWVEVASLGGTTVRLVVRVYQ